MHRIFFVINMFDLFKNNFFSTYVVVICLENLSYFLCMFLKFFNLFLFLFLTLMTLKKFWKYVSCNIRWLCFFSSLIKYLSILDHYLISFLLFNIYFFFQFLWSFIILLSRYQKINLVFDFCHFLFTVFKVH